MQHARVPDEISSSIFSKTKPCFKNCYSTFSIYFGMENHLVSTCTMIFATYCIGILKSVV